MATLLVKLTIKEGKEARYEELQSELYRQTHELEPKVLRYEAWRAPEERTYYALLAYPDYASFMLDHQTSDHHEAATRRSCSTSSRPRRSSGSTRSRAPRRSHRRTSSRSRRMPATLPASTTR